MHVNKAVYNYVDDDWKPSRIAEFVLFASSLSSHLLHDMKDMIRRKLSNRILIIC